MKPEKTRTTLNSMLILLSALAMLTLVACTAQQSDSSDDVSEVAKTAESSNTSTDVLENHEGDGMNMTLDGTSLAAFDASMEEIKRNTDEQSYKTLTNAIEYLLVYELSAQKNKEKLALVLNGLTGYEVLGKVGWRRAAPGKGDAEIGAADARIDT
jgi:hypothetical protein